MREMTEEEMTEEEMTEEEYDEYREAYDPGHWAQKYGKHETNNTNYNSGAFETIANLIAFCVIIYIILLFLGII
ncbi:hypothetical protein [Methanothrix sp.]|uniref:hypothetical protein n=1 Tax=Methanothrix sp. TaxID=90426 RepID=UPI001BD3E5A1